MTDKQVTDKLKAFFENKEVNRSAIIIFFCMVFAFGIMSYQKFGISWDEEDTLENVNLTAEYVQNYISYLFGSSELDSADYDNYRWNTNGCTIRLPIYYVAKLMKMDIGFSQYYRWSHLYCFLTFYIGLIFFFLLLKRIFNSDWLALIGVAILTLSPRVLADSFYNLKDINLLSIFIINIYVFSLALDNPGWRNYILFGLVSALCINTRIFGGIVFGVGVIILAMQKEKAGARIGFFLTESILTFVLFFIMTPYLWRDTVPHMAKLLKSNVAFPWVGPMLFEGRIVIADNLPWYYMLKWIMITTPVIFLVLFCVGMFFVCKSVYTSIKTRTVSKEQVIEYSSVAMLLLIIAAYIIIRPIDYDEWRHFRFLYPLIVIVAVEAIRSLTKIGKVNIAMGIILAVQIIYLAGWNVINCPYNYVYFNGPSRQYANQFYERDYWYISLYNAIETLMSTGCDESYKLYVPITNSYLMMEEEEWSQFTYTTEENCVYYIDTWRSQNINNAHQDMEDKGFTLFYEKAIDGVVVYDIYKRMY